MNRHAVVTDDNVDDAALILLASTRKGSASMPEIR